MNLKHVVDVRIEYAESNRLRSGDLAQQEGRLRSGDLAQQGVGDVAEALGLDMILLKVAALATLKHCDVREACEITIVISGDPTLRDLNRRFRGVDRSTDVLAFPNDSRGPFAGGGPDFPRYLGDIVISLDRAQEQAESVGGTLNQEVQLLIVHGTLHLLGYDHMAPKEKAQMWKIQQTILELLGVDIAPDDHSGSNGDSAFDEYSES